jgi:YgiT-type zinc finger domain-containing protein
MEFGFQNQKNKHITIECIICKNGILEEGKDTVTFEKEGHLIIIREVPGEVCDNCGHFYVGSEAAIEIQKKVKKTVADGAELEILKYA